MKKILLRHHSATGVSCSLVEMPDHMMETKIRNQLVRHLVRHTDYYTFEHNPVLPYLPKTPRDWFDLAGYLTPPKPKRYGVLYTLVYLLLIVVLLYYAYVSNT